MGMTADSLFNVLMSWVRALVSGLWALFSSDHTTVLEFLGKNWLLIAAALIAGGLVIDWIIWLLRWQPYHLWAQRARRLLRMEREETQEEAPAKAHAAVMPEKKYARPVPEEEPEEAPLYVHSMDEEEDMLSRADSVPDEELSAYPGMLYGSRAADERMDETQMYGAVTQTGPGAAEVERRRAEIDAWQLQMQEEARARAEAERLAKERAQREAQRIEQARLARETYAAEQARKAQEAYAAEQDRLAQEQYERELEEYERQKAQYELELAEYERQQAEYEAQLAMQQEAASAAPAACARRRRTAERAYSDYVDGETVEQLPDAPAWPDMPKTSAGHSGHEKKSGKGSQILDRVARMIEPEEESLVVRKTLPPRVDMKDAFRTAKLPVVTPPRSGRRKK